MFPSNHILVKKLMLGPCRLLTAILDHIHSCLYFSSCHLCGLVQEIMADYELSFTHHVPGTQPVSPHFLSPTCILLIAIHFYSLKLITEFAANQRRFYILPIKKLCSYISRVLIVIAPAD